jgi:hypothetical protein
MEIKNLLVRFILLIALAGLLPLSVSAIDVKAVYGKSDELQTGDKVGGKSIQANPLENITFSYEKRLTLENGSVMETLDVKSQRANSLQKQQAKGLYLDANEFIEIKDVDNRPQLFNGAVILKFIELPDFVQFASNYGLVFVADLSDISRGVFKVENLYELDQKITELALDKNIISIELDTIDPTVRVN